MEFYIIKKIQKNKIDKEFVNAYNQYFKDILKYCCVRLYIKDSSMAVDCAQEAFALLFIKMNSGEEINHIRGWLYRTVDNFIKRENALVAKHFKNVDFLNDLDLDNILYTEEDNLDFIIENEGIDIDECLVLVLNQLNTEERLLYQKHYKERIPISLLAKQYNISATALTSRIYRLKKKIESIVPEIINDNTCHLKVGGLHE